MRVGKVKNMFDLDEIRLIRSKLSHRKSSCGPTVRLNRFWIKRVQLYCHFIGCICIFSCNLWVSLSFCLSVCLSVCLSERLRFLSDCHCNDWSFETYFIHPYNSAQSFRLPSDPPPLPVFLFLFFPPPSSFSLTVLYKISIDCFWPHDQLGLQAFCNVITSLIYFVNICYKVTFTITVKGIILLCHQKQICKILKIWFKWFIC